MKNLFRFLMAVAVLFTASCAKEDISTSLVGNGETVEVTFSANLADLGTRAYGDGTQVNTLRYYVYDEAFNELTALCKKAKAENVESDFDDFKATVRLQLVKGMTYNILFWADNGSGIYSIKNGVVSFDAKDEAENVIIDANDESRDAFFGVKSNFTVGQETDVILKRPFAQLNAYATDIESVHKSGVNITNSTISANIYTTLNPFATEDDILQRNDVGGLTDAVVTFAINNEKTIQSANGEHVSMNYLFAPANGCVANVTMTFVANKENVTIPPAIYSNIPLKANYKTNVIGNLLTSSTDFQVTIDANWGGETDLEVWNGTLIEEPAVSTSEANTYEIYNPTQLAWLAAAVNGELPESRADAPQSFKGKTFTLMDNIDLGGHEWTPIGTKDTPFAGVFNGNDKVIKNLVVTGGSESYKGLFGKTTAGAAFNNVTIENAKVSGRLNVGALVGEPEGATAKGIKLLGHVEVNGMAYVGGVAGKHVTADWSNITVEVDATSYVKAHSIENGTAYRTYVGGVVGFMQAHKHKLSNVKSNINVKGSTMDVGGIVGIAHYNNEFENIECSGNVEIYAAEVAAEAQEIGGIAGVWYNGVDNKKQPVTVAMTNCEFTGTLTTNIECAKYYGGLVGKYYDANDTTGKLILNGNYYVASVAELQAALNAAEGETTLYLGYDIVGDVTVVQKQDVKVTIIGDNHKFNGTIKVHSNSNHYADAALTIKNVNFETSVASVNVIEALENGAKRYSTNITVEGCTFTATGEAENTAVGVQIKSSKNAKVIGCTATNMHSLIQAQSCDETVVVNGCTINGKNGVAFKQVKAATVEGTTITALEYGIRFDGNIDNYGIVVKDNNVTAVQPLIVRKMTGANNTITLEGTNTLTTEAEYQIVITNGSDDEDYVKPTGTYTLTGADSFKVFPAMPAAKVGNTEYTSIDEAIENWTNGSTLTLLKNVTLSDVVTLKSTEHHILNLDTYTLTAASGKHAIEITCNGRSSASYALTVNADATNPGGITATGKSCIYYKKSGSEKDRPIILINNGVFTGSYSINSTSNGNTNCPQIWINGGVFNSYMNLTKNMLRVSGGTFHAAINCTGDSSAYREIKGGRFKSWQFMTADAPTKFWVGSGNGNYDVGVYVDDEGYLVVGGPVITEFGDKFAAKATNYSKWSSYLKYSSAAEHGLYYTNAAAAIAKHGEANVVLK